MKLYSKILLLVFALILGFVIYAIYSFLHLDFVGKTAEQVEESNRYLNTIKLEAGYESNGYRHEQIRLHENKTGFFKCDSLMFDFNFSLNKSGLLITDFNTTHHSVFDTCFLLVENKKIYYKLNAERMYDKNISLDIFYSKFDHNDSTSTDTIK
jgi:hypothetical protein